MTNLNPVVLNALEDLKAIDITALDVRSLTNITDYMLIATGTSARHIKAIADNVLEQAHKHGLSVLGIEGIEGETDWVLIDLNNVVVHVMLASAREFYELEKLWAMQPIAFKQQPVEDFANAS